MQRAFRADRSRSGFAVRRPIVANSEPAKAETIALRPYIRPPANSARANAETVTARPAIGSPAYSARTEADAMTFRPDIQSTAICAGSEAEAVTGRLSGTDFARIVCAPLTLTGGVPGIGNGHTAARAGDEQPCGERAHTRRDTRVRQRHDLPPPEQRLLARQLCVALLSHVWAIYG